MPKSIFPLAACSCAIMLTVFSTSPAIATVTEQDCSLHDQLAQQTVDEIMEESENVYDKVVTEPDWSDLQKCIDGIINAGVGIDLGIPSWDTLLNQACRTLKSQARQQLNSLGQRYSVNGVGGVSGGVSGTATSGNRKKPFNVRVSDTSSRAARSIWDSIQ